MVINSSYINKTNKLRLTTLTVKEDILDIWMDRVGKFCLAMTHQWHSNNKIVGKYDCCKFFLFMCIHLCPVPKGQRELYIYLFCSTSGNPFCRGCIPPQINYSIGPTLYFCLCPGLWLVKSCNQKCLPVWKTASHPPAPAESKLINALMEDAQGCFVIKPWLACQLQKYNETTSYTKTSYNRIDGVMVSVLTSSVVDRGFESQSGQTRL